MCFRKSQRRRQTFLIFAALLLATAVDVAGQQGGAQSLDQKKTPEAATQPSDDTDVMEQLRKGLRQLTAAVQRLTKRVTDLEKERLVDVTRILLIGEEQRAETLQAKLRETFEKQIILQVRLEQVEAQLRPESIERMFAGIGSTRPEEVRETVLRRLAFEKQGIVAQLELLRQERNRFQAGLASVDVSIQRLRLRLSQAGRP